MPEFFVGWSLIVGPLLNVYTAGVRWQVTNEERGYRTVGVQDGQSERKASRYRAVGPS